MPPDTRDLTIEAIRSRIKSLAEEQADWLEVLRTLVPEDPPTQGPPGGPSFPEQAKHAPG